jgi:cytochrome c553
MPRSDCHRRAGGTLFSAVAAVLLVTTAARAGPGTADKADPRASFALHVRPVLAKNCFHCHGSEKPKRGLDLSRIETILAGGASGPALVPRDAGASRIYRYVQPGSEPHMPPKKLLGPLEIEALGEWIDGLPADLTAASLAAAPRDEQPWAFRELRRPEPPAVRDAAWPRSPIDRFILAELEEHGLSPSPEAAKTDLIRRVSLDLVGLPPTPEEVAAFLADDSPTAYERVIDRLLASPRHGERWARHWLDLARYAESEGFKSDEVRPNAWRYRDYVIQSLNADKPFDRFVAEQVAGDELWPGDPDALVATGFNRHYPDESNARNLMQRRQEILNDVTDTAAQVFLGLTYGCARCHDHKYDPISQADYYRLQAFFANTGAADDVPLVPPAAVDEHGRRLAAWEKETAAIREQMHALEEPQRQKIAGENFAKFPTEVQDAITRPAAERTPFEELMYRKARPYLHPEKSVVVEALPAEKKKIWQSLRKELDGFTHLHPGELPRGMGITDAGRTAPKTFLLSGGAYDAPQGEVEPGFPGALAGGTGAAAATAIEPPSGLASTGRRAALARWLTDPKNPLVPRVIANRLWHHHFGRGIAGTPSDFGSMGDPPTHPELLDWLAAELIEGSWSLKRLHRLMVTSSAYRQSAAHREDAARVDPQDLLLWRFRRSRLDGEVIRDAALAVAGLLDLRAGGPSVFPELPKGMEARYGWKPSASAEERNRRSIYVFVRRNLRYPLFEAFDMPDTHETCARRNVTTTAPQALILLNDHLTLEWARAFAARVAAAAGANPAARVRAAYRLAYARDPESREVEAALAFFARHRQALGEEGKAIATAGKAGQGSDAGAADEPSGAANLVAAVLADFCHTLLNSNEFVYGS